jgi:hypothetical protein
MPNTGTVRAMFDLGNHGEQAARRQRNIVLSYLNARAPGIDLVPVGSVLRWLSLAASDSHHPGPVCIR